MNIDKDQDLEEYKQTTNECMQILAEKVVDLEKWASETPTLDKIAYNPKNSDENLNFMQIINDLYSKIELLDKKWIICIDTSENSKPTPRATTIMAMYRNGIEVKETRPKKTRQGSGSHTKYSASSRNKKRKPYRGQGK